MTPQEIFQQLLSLFPKAWDKNSQIAWANQFSESLTGIDPDVLEKAFKSVMRDWTYSKPPTPGDIRKAIGGSAPKYEKVEPRFKYRQKADQLMKTNPLCKEAVRDGWGFGMFQHIAEHGELPGAKAQKHLIESNKEFWRLHAAMEEGRKVHMDTSIGEIVAPIPSICTGFFNKLIAKRAAIEKRYGQ